MKCKGALGRGLLMLVIPCFVSAVPPPSAPEDSARRLPLLLRTLDRTSRLLYVTAHPDDEDSGLLSYYAHGQGVETALLTLTRGEGGQNEIGTELFHALGVLRARELQAAHRYDGARQFFSRAFEFGYSFSVEETYRKWGKERVLRDIVRVYRRFRPHVVITMSPAGEGGGQHHQASARLAAEAYDLAASGEVWPELGSPHTVERLFRKVGRDEPVANPVTVPLGRFDPVLGCSYAELGATARHMHKCQGMVRRESPFLPRRARLEWIRSRDETIRPVPGVFAGLGEPHLAGSGADAVWAKELRARVARTRDRHRTHDPHALLPDLFEVWDLVTAHPEHPAGDPDLAELRTRAAESILLAAGIRIAARSARPWLAAGDPFRVEVVIDNRAPQKITFDLSLVGPGVAEGPSERGEVGPGRRVRRAFETSISPHTPPTIATAVPESATGAEAESTWIDPGWAVFRVTGAITIEGRRLSIPPLRVDVVDVEPTFPSLRRSDVHVVPDPSLRAGREIVSLPTPAASSPRGSVEFFVATLRGGPVEVRTSAPEGWAVTPEVRRVSTKAGGVETPVHFRLVGPPRSSAPIEVTARARYPDGDTWSSDGTLVIEYPHIRRGALLRPARVRIVPFPCEVVPRRVGYVAGTGDDVPRSIRTLGLEPVLLGATELLAGDLARFDTIVTGVRAYKVREDLKAAHERLLAWVEAGGTLIVQYNKFEFNDAAPGGMSPYAPWKKARVDRARVTDEESPVKVLAPDHPLFQTPNLIRPRDWESWVQERGLYLLEAIDDRYVDLLELEDPWPYNSGPKRGALVEVPMGDGRWIYVGLGLFRQLPAGVPGAYRLIANLLAR